MKIAGKIVLVSVILNGIIFSILVDAGSEQLSIDPKVATHGGLASQGTEQIQKNFRDLVVVVTEIGKHSYWDSEFQSCKRWPR